MHQKPEKLSAGDKIGIVVPSSPVKEPFRSSGLDKVRELGYVPVEARDILARNGFVAKQPADNIRDIESFWSDSAIKGIWAARGGYGSNHLLPFLKQLEIPGPKILIGSSDLSYLLWYMMDRFKMVVFYGPMAYASLAENRVNSKQLQAVLRGSDSENRIQGRVLLAGKSGGILTGGCLSNFVSLVGTDFFPEIDQRILLLEDRDEKPHRLDRMFWQLSHSGVFSRIRGLILGEFPGCFRDREEKEQFLSRLKVFLSEVNIPVVYDLPLGHSENVHTVPLGITVEIDTGAFEGFWFEEKAVL
jgi:muramoyltetrapeptide carboxypeptidase